MDNTSLHPIGHISFRVGDHDASGVVKPWIMTDLGWRLAAGGLYDKSVYPRLWSAMPERRIGNFVEVPDLRPGRVELQPYQMPAQSYTHHVNYPGTHNHSFNTLADVRDNARFDPYFMHRYTTGYVVGMDPAGQFRPITTCKQQGDAIGKVDDVTTTDAGLIVKMELRDEISKHIYKTVVDTANLESLLPKMHGLKGMKWGERRTSTSTKENSMTVKLKTPTENIERKDLAVALDLMGTNDRDHLLNAIALVQELEENQTLHRARDFDDDTVEFVDHFVRIPNSKVTGFCTDVVSTQPDYKHADIRMVIDGKIHTVDSLTYIVVELEGPAPLGEDTLRIVRD